MSDTAKVIKGFSRKWDHRTSNRGVAVEISAVTNLTDASDTDTFIMRDNSPYNVVIGITHVGIVTVNEQLIAALQHNKLWNRLPAALFPDDTEFNTTWVEELAAIVAGPDDGNGDTQEDDDLDD